MTKTHANNVSRKKMNALFALVIVAVVAGTSLATNAFGQSVEARNAVIHASDGSEYTMLLDKNDVLVVTTDLGTNVIQVNDGSVSVSDADCPNHDCVTQGAISHAGQQIVCLPHKLTVDVVGEGTSSEYDVMGS